MRNFTYMYIYNNWSLRLKDKDYLVSLLFGLLFLAASLVVNYYAGVYATESVSNSVTDLILNNTRVYDLDSIFVYGSIAFWTFVLLYCSYEPKRTPFILKSVALFIVIRSVFVSLTHIGPFPEQAALESDLISKLSFGGDLFFSGHTGLPFLLTLIFWDNLYLRLLFLFSSFVFGVVVLLTHMHYSIDVLSAFFITYSIFRIATLIFKDDYRRSAPAQLSE